MADNDNPFASDNRTVFVPSPGGQRRRDRPPGSAPERPAASGSPGPPAAPEAAVKALRVRPSGVNPLIDAALGLLTLGAQLRHTAEPHDIGSLRARVERAMEDFESAARDARIEREATLTGRYLLCTFIDEMVLSTPWGSRSAWSQNSMLSRFHRETHGGEKFFTIVDRLLQDPGRSIDLLELAYVAIALGFEGQYRIRSDGRSRLTTVEESIYQVIRNQRGDFERDLSPAWRGIDDRSGALARSIPLWVVGALAAAVLLGLYLAFSYSLSRNAAPLEAALLDVGGAPVPRIQGPTEAPTAQTLGLRVFLAPEIARSEAEVIEFNDRTAVLIQGDGLFPSGSAAPNSRFLPLFSRIAEGIAREPGDVLVTGHTDNVPIRTLRFPSNWDLSAARADAVAQLLRDLMPSGAGKLVAAEGRADTEPLVPNDTAENRARNRRVEIILVGQSAQ
jgi:type VI secretion system protein ImpK